MWWTPSSSRLPNSRLRPPRLAAVLIVCCFGLGCGVSAAAAAETLQQNSSAGHATVAYPQFTKNEASAAFRDKLLQACWQPEKAADADQCMAGDARCEGRPEMQSCAGTGEANCLFLWRKGDALLAVSTVGIPASVAAVECRSHCQ
jgi:hypothetical protein